MLGQIKSIEVDELAGLNTLVIIPAFNEESNIVGVVRMVRSVVPASTLLVIDDGSTDRTAQLARAAGAIVASLPFNVGYGVAVQTGYYYANRHNYDYLVQLDSDGQHDPEYIRDLLNAVREPEIDIAIGSRWLGQSEYKGPVLRKFGKIFFGFLASLLTKNKVTDPTSGFQALSQPVVRFFCSEAYPADYPDADVIIMLHRAGFRIKEVPVIMNHDLSGHSMHSGIRPLYYGMKMMMSILMTLLRDDHDLLRRSK